MWPNMTSIAQSPRTPSSGRSLFRSPLMKASRSQRAADTRLAHLGSFFWFLSIGRPRADGGGYGVSRRVHNTSHEAQHGRIACLMGIGNGGRKPLQPPARQCSQFGHSALDWMPRSATIRFGAEYPNTPPPGPRTLPHDATPTPAA